MGDLYVALLRGVNVGGKNKLPMAALRTCLEELGCRDVQTYIASGNVIFRSDKNASEIAKEIEETLPKKFTLDAEVISILILTHDQLRAIVLQAPKGFGAEPGTYYSDAIFLIGITADDAIKVFNPRDGVDKIWQGNGVIYSQRLSAERTKSRLSAIMSSPLYKKMTIRSWNTTVKLLALMDTLEQK